MSSARPAAGHWRKPGRPARTRRREAVRRGTRPPRRRRCRRRECAEADRPRPIGQRPARRRPASARSRPRASRVRAPRPDFRWPRYMSQGTSNAASRQRQHMTTGARRDAPPARAAGKRASRMTNISISAVVAAADSCDATPAAPSPNRSLTASLASAPPVSGNPARLRPSNAATMRASVRARPSSAATAPTVRNRAAFTSTWFAA